MQTLTFPTNNNDHVILFIVSAQLTQNPIFWILLKYHMLFIYIMPILQIYVYNNGPIKRLNTINIASSETHKGRQTFKTGNCQIKKAAHTNLKADIYLLNVIWENNKNCKPTSKTRCLSFISQFLKFKFQESFKYSALIFGGKN